MNTPILCSDAAVDPLACRMAFDLIEGAPGELMYLPAGEHTVNVMQGNRAVTKTVTVTPESVAPINAQLAHIRSIGKSPMFDFDHDDRAASFRPTEFVWRDHPRPGVYAIGQWTGSGQKAVQGKDYLFFSPRVHVEEGKSPARVITRTADTSPNMGGLVNDPAFVTISPVRAKHAGASSEINHSTHTKMNEQEIAALQAKNQELSNELQALKAKQSKNDTDAAVAEAIAAKEAEINANNLKLENEALKAKAAKLESDDLARRTADAKKFADDMVARGAIAAKDETARKEVEKNMTENPALFAPIYAKWSSNPAVTPGAAQTRSAVTVVANAPKDILRAFAAITAKNSSATTPAEKAAAAIEAAHIYESDLRDSEKSWMGMPIQEAIRAADVTDAAVGTLAGTLVLQRTLPLFKYQYPLLGAVFTDFSDSVGLYQQTEVSRIVISPAVQSYDATLDSNGNPKGFVVTKPAQTVDVPITLDEYVAVKLLFGNVALASTIRNLFGEQSEMALNALAGYFVDKATALMTSANFNAYAGNSATSGATTDGSTTITVTSTANMYPGQAISGTGIPANTRIASVTNSTTAVLTQKATATNTGLTFTLNGGLVPDVYATYAKAKADFSLAALDEISGAFDTNKVPLTDRGVLLNSPYYNRLRQDPALNMFFAAQQSPEIITKGSLPELTGFAPMKAPYFPSSSNRVGFAFHKAAIALKSRVPQDFTQATGAMVPGTVTMVTDPETRLSVMLVQRVDLTGNYAEWRIETMLGAAVGDRRGGLVITSE